VPRCQNPQVRTKLLSLAAAVSIGAALVSGSPAASAEPDDVMTLTLVRHAQSEANAGGVFDTTVPGASLTALGEQQAKDAAIRLSASAPDGVFASTMARTQQTAQYLADETGQQVTVLPGLREISAGIYEGQSQDTAGTAMYDVIARWFNGDTEARIPGGENGREFLDRFNGAVNHIYTSGDRQPVAFSHGAAIGAWALMSVSNPRQELFASQPLPNTGYVVVQGNPSIGWKLLDWNGTAID
jgi:broad specificity phosphatase PhoE